jgi:thiol-disulfide isomerase/thioredoxin
MRIMIVLFFVVLYGCKDSSSHKSESVLNLSDASNDMTLEVYDYEGLKPFLNRQDDKVHVVNFWATWCAPCVKEMPYFEQINTKYASNNVEVLFVSLDFPRQYDTQLKPFIKDKNIKSKVICLDDTDQNTWIPAIDATWSGAIPATLIYKGSKRQFYEQTFTYNQLETEVLKFLN